jgi:hypothetical protein
MRALRVVLVVHALAVFTQAALAGNFLSGEDSAVKYHEVTGWIVPVLCLIQIVIAVTRKGTPLAFTIASIATFLGEGLQVGTGYGRFLNVHIPLSVLLAGALAGQIVWAFRRRTQR